MIFEIDPQYKIVNRIIDIDGINDIKAIKLKYMNYEVIGYGKESERKRQEKDWINR